MPAVLLALDRRPPLRPRRRALRQRRRRRQLQQLRLRSARQPCPNPCGDPPEAGRLAALPGPAHAGDPSDPTGLNGTIIRIDPETGAGWPTNPLYGSDDRERAADRRLRLPQPVPLHHSIRRPTRSTSATSAPPQFEEIDRFDPLRRQPLQLRLALLRGRRAAVSSSRTLGLPTLRRPLRRNRAADRRPSAVLLLQPQASTVVPGDECPTSPPARRSRGSPSTRGTNFPAEYKGALFFADSVRGLHLRDAARRRRRTPTRARSSPFLTGGSNYPGVDIQEGPDGALYYASLFGEDFGTGAIHRITYAPGAPRRGSAPTPQCGRRAARSRTRCQRIERPDRRTARTSNGTSTATAASRPKAGETQSVKLTGSGKRSRRRPGQRRVKG